MVKIAMFALVGVILAISTGLSEGLTCKVGTTGAYTESGNCTVCSKSTVSGSGITTSASSCDTSCTAASYSILSISYGVYCCTTDLCNTAATQTSSIVGLVVASSAVLLRAMH